MPPHPRIGLFGGTFDPVHDGHLHLAGLAREALALDQIRFLPCRISPHKPGTRPASAEARLEMLRRATRDIPWAVVDDYELIPSRGWDLQSQSVEGTSCPLSPTEAPSYSYLTAQAMAARLPQARLFWIMGADQWAVLGSWRHSEILASLVDFIVLARDGQHPAPRDGHRLHIVHGEHPASATAIRLAATDSSTPVPWLHPEVAAWIQSQRLYQGQASKS